MRHGGAIEREPALSGEAAIDLRQADGVTVQGGAPPGIRTLGVNHRAQLHVAAPERADVQRQAALDVGEHRLVAFRPQQSAAFFAVELEIAHLCSRVAHMGLHAEQRPAAQALEGKLFEQTIEPLQHGGDARRRQFAELAQELEPGDVECAVVHAAGGDDGVCEHLLGRARVGACVNGKRRVDGLEGGILTDFACDCRRLTEIGQRHAPAQARGGNLAGALEIAYQALRRERSRRLQPGGLHQLARVRPERL